MTESVAIIDVWDVGTFDSELRGALDAHTDVIRDYMLTSRRQWLEREASDRTMPYPENPYAGEFMWVKEHIMRLMEVRTIRAWHYTRLTEAEVDVLRQGGIYSSSLDTIRSRFAAQVAAGAFTQEVADRLFADSPYQSDQLHSRSDKFWMVSHPVDVEDGGVELLLESWGGESAYFWQRDAALQEMLKQIGRPRVLEIAMPLVHSRHGYSAAEAVVATYGRLLGCRPDKHAFDLYTHQPLGPEHVLAVHSEGEPNFGVMARGYPTGFVDLNLGPVGRGMSGADTAPDAVAFLRGIAGELAEIHRGSDYSLWRGEVKHRVDQYLSRAEPFSDFATCWVFSGDGGGSVVGGRFGEWTGSSKK